MSDSRLPAHLEVSGLIRAVGLAGGFVTVLAKGERDSGTILVVCCEGGQPRAAYERMPQVDGSRKWTQVRNQGTENSREIYEYCERRQLQDGDLWIVELDIVNAERFIE